MGAESAQPPIEVSALLEQALRVTWKKPDGTVVLTETITYLDPARTLEGKRIET